MRLLRLATLLAAASIFIAAPASAQSTARDATREKVRQVLETAGARSDVNVAFRQSTKNPYNFIGSMTANMENADSMEVLVSITKSDTIAFRVYPHYKKAYINLGRVSDANGFARKLLLFTEQNYMYWGADEMGDVFSGFTISLESGFPQEVMVIVLRSIKSSDECVGELRPFIDGSKGI